MLLTRWVNLSILIQINNNLNAIPNIAHAHMNLKLTLLFFAQDKSNVLRFPHLRDLFLLWWMPDNYLDIVIGHKAYFVEIKYSEFFFSVLLMLSKYLEETDSTQNIQLRNWWETQRFIRFMREQLKFRGLSLQESGSVLQSRNLVCNVLSDTGYKCNRNWYEAYVIK